MSRSGTDPCPGNADRRELVVVLYDQKVRLADIAERSGFTERGVARILARARAAGDPRAKKRGATTEHRQALKAKTVRWASDRGQMPGRLSVDLGADLGVGGIASDFDEGRL